MIYFARMGEIEQRTAGKKLASINVVTRFRCWSYLGRLNGFRTLQARAIPV
jgi:hypothetical protein